MLPLDSTTGKSWDWRYHHMRLTSTGIKRAFRGKIENETNCFIDGEAGTTG